MNYELHKTTEEGYDTVQTFAKLVRELSSLTLSNMIGKYKIDITIKKID